MFMEEGVPSKIYGKDESKSSASYQRLFTGTQRGVIPFTDWVNRAGHISPDALPNCPWEEKVMAEFSRNKACVERFCFIRNIIPPCINYSPDSTLQKSKVF